MIATLNYIPLPVSEDFIRYYQTRLTVTREQYIEKELAKRGISKQDVEQGKVKIACATSRDETEQTYSIIGGDVLLRIVRDGNKYTFYTDEQV